MAVLWSKLDRVFKGNTELLIHLRNYIHTLAPGEHLDVVMIAITSIYLKKR